MADVALRRKRGADTSRLADLCARRLLIGTNYTIGAIAARCGYENIYYFSRAFRKAVGCSPSEFRERAR